jgi:hypothetical protein
MSSAQAFIEGIAFWGSGLPSWDAARAFVNDGTVPEACPRKPQPSLLPPNERRRAPDSVALAIEVAQAACSAAAREPATLPSVFTSTHGDLAITDTMCATLAEAPLTISPTKFHNSVHNAAAGYWTIGSGCMVPATAISAYRASFAQGLLEALALLAAGEDAVLLVAYDAEGRGPLAAISRSEGLLAGALVLGREARPGAVRLALQLEPGPAPEPEGALARRFAMNAMQPMLPLFEVLAGGREGHCLLQAGPGQTLSVEAGP